MKERFKPFNNHVIKSKKSLLDNIKLYFRFILDLQVKTVFKTIKKYINTTVVIYSGGRLLDVGCGNSPYKGLLPNNIKYIGLDYNMAEENFDYVKPDDVVLYDGKEFPFENNSFDFLYHTDVLEHIIEPHLFLSECHRVLKENGSMFFSVPFQARYHYIPFDYYRYTPSGLKNILENSGFYDIKIEERGSDVTVAAYKVIAVFYRMLLDTGIKGLFNKILAIILSPIFCVSMLIAHISLIFNIGSKDDCLGYSVTAKKGIKNE